MNMASMTHHSQRYWQCQWLGWSLVAGTNFGLQLLRATSTLTAEAISNLLFLLLGIGSSHGLRWLYRRFAIIDKPLAAMVLPFFGFTFVATAALITGLFTVMSVVVMPNDSNLLTGKNILGNILGLYPLLLIWSSCYLGVHYLWRWRQSEVDKLTLANALKDAQLNTLIGQINPHFMFNALNNIRALMLEDVDKARHGLALLAKVLRYSLTAPSQGLVPLSQELSAVQDFVELAQLQYERRLQWQRAVAPELEQVLVPAMMLQMLVENAVKHGIAQVRGGGVLQLTVRAEAQQLRVTVTNPGQLRSPQAQLNGQHTQPATHEPSTQLGVNNVEQRLALLYGERAQFSLQQLPESTATDNTSTGNTAAPQVIATLVLPLSHVVPKAQEAVCPS